MVCLNWGAALAVEAEVDALTDFEIAICAIREHVCHRIADFLDGENRESLTLIFKHARVAFLSAHFRKEYRLVGNDELLTLLMIDFKDFCLTIVLLKPEESGDGISFEIKGFNNGLFLRGAGALTSVSYTHLTLPTIYSV